MSREEHPFLKIQLILIMIGENRQKKANGGKLVFFLFFLPFYSEKQKELFYSSPFTLLEN
jgi:hypothetical protein